LNFAAVRHLFHPLTDDRIAELVRQHGGIEEGVSLDDVGLQEWAERVVAEREQRYMRHLAKLAERLRSTELPPED
jgi:hypothetical protein